MYVYICICMCVCVCVCVSIYIYIYIHTYIHTYDISSYIYIYGVTHCGDTERRCATGARGSATRRSRNRKRRVRIPCHANAVAFARQRLVVCTRWHAGAVARRQPSMTRSPLKERPGDSHQSCQAKNKEIGVVDMYLVKVIS
jgi:hypothetical protein